MPPNRNIYLDLDDVICETCHGFLDLLQREFQRRVAFEDVVAFDLRRSFRMTDEEVEVFMARAHQPDILSALKPLPRALETIREWTDRGCSIDIMTGRPPAVRGITEEWLERHDVRYSSLDFVDKYGRIAMDPSFADALTLEDLASRRYCLAVEDSAATAAFLCEREVAPVVLMDRPWNRTGGDARARRMADWRELAQAISFPCPGI